MERGGDVLVAVPKPFPMAMRTSPPRILSKRGSVKNAPSPMPRPELRGRLARCRPERPGESAVVVESGSQRHLGDREIGLGQHLRSRREARLGDQLAGCDPEDALDQPRKTHRRQPRALCQPGRGHGLRVLRLQILQRRGQRTRYHLAVTRSPQVPRDPHQPEDLSLPIAPRQLRGQAPPRTPPWIPVELQTIADRVSGADNVGVLCCVTRRQGRREELAHTAPEKLARLPKPNPLRQRPVHRHVPPGQVLHEEGRVRNMIEQRRQTRRFRRQRREWPQISPAFGCASFH